MTRPQVALREDSPGRSRIVEEYRLLTGLPLTIETGFNTRKVPVVSIPYDGIHVFQVGYLDDHAVGGLPVRNPAIAVIEPPARGGGAEALVSTSEDARL